MVCFSLPGLLEFQKMNLWLLNLYKEHREVFYADVVIDSIYGSFPNVIWNGGRNLPYKYLTGSEMESVFEDYGKYNVKLRFTFTNLLLEPKHLEDSYSNSLLSLIDKYSAEITIASDMLKNYISDLHPGVSFVSSTTKCITSAEELNKEINKGYKLVVLDFRKNADFEFLNKLKNKDKIEILLNEDCYCTCKNRSRHYRDISQNILMYDKMPNTEYYCEGKYNNLYDSFQQETTITVEKLYHQYNDMGFKYFKIRGRSSCCFDVLESYVYYLIKPENRDMVRLEALQAGVCRSF